MTNLRIPGPTPCPPEVLQAMSWQMKWHRGKEFVHTFDDVTTKLKQLARTKGDVYLLTASGTGGLEAAVVNTLSVGDMVLGISNGVFGERFAIIGEKFGAEVIPLNFEYGQAVDPTSVRRILQAKPKIKAVLVTHNETSTGVTNDLASISSVVKEFDKLLLVDAISSLGSISLPIDEWRCDVTVTASQKGWMTPPGMTIVFLSQEALKASATADMPRFYWDFTEIRENSGRPTWTPAVSIVFALSVALDRMLKEGLSNILARHKRIAQITRDGVKALGLQLFVDERYASNTVTAVVAPEGLDVDRLLEILREECQTVLAAGLEKLRGKIFRIGHLGLVTEDDIAQVISALRVALPQAGFRGAG